MVITQRLHGNALIIEAGKFVTLPLLPPDPNHVGLDDYRAQERQALVGCIREILESSDKAIITTVGLSGSGKTTAVEKAIRHFQPTIIPRTDTLSKLKIESPVSIFEIAGGGALQNYMQIMGGLLTFGLDCYFLYFFPKPLNQTQQQEAAQAGISYYLDKFGNHFLGNTPRTLISPEDIETSVVISPNEFILYQLLIIRDRHPERQAETRVSENDLKRYREAEKWMATLAHLLSLNDNSLKELFESILSLYKEKTPCRNDTASGPLVMINAARLLITQALLDPKKEYTRPDAAMNTWSRITHSDLKAILGFTHKIDAFVEWFLGENQEKTNGLSRDKQTALNFMRTLDEKLLEGATRLLW